MSKGFRFTIRTTLPSHYKKDAIWKHITNMSNVNAELMPYIYMTYPEEAAQSGLDQVPLRTTLFMSVILLFGLIPIDFHWLKFDSLKINEGFQENSTTMLQQYWKHHRYLTERNGSVEVTDELEFLPRLPLVGYLLLPVIRFIFEHRHAQLKKILK
jgi:ligand-binding SRPBCC domain-containing protein